MRIFAISDLQLGKIDFEWHRGLDELARRWDKIITQNDAVIMPGGFSLALTKSELAADLRWLAARPGQVYLCPSNMEKWRKMKRRDVREILPLNVTLVSQSYTLLDNGRIALVMDRGRPTNGMPWYSAARDRRPYLLFKKYLLTRLRAVYHVPYKIVAVHLPPFEVKRGGHLIYAIAGHRVNQVLYGHLGRQHKELIIDGDRWGMRFLCVSAEHVDFYPRLVLDTESLEGGSEIVSSSD